VRGALPEPSATLRVVAPFTLRSQGVTVWELGTIQRDTFAPRFWSSKGCLFHHAYPVGYRAAKSHFGRAYSMHILAGACGPRFRVVDTASGESFEGDSPTQPWTLVCTSKRLGTRISGPLFFGFSDPLTQRALAALYTPDELTAARAGGTVASAAPCAVERCAAELRASLEGLGDKTSFALAASRSLLPDGTQLGGIEQLRTLARADGGARLADWLLRSNELSDATRRWPLWAAVFVPRILAAVLGQADDGGGGAACVTPPQLPPAGGGPPRSGRRVRPRPSSP
jgi:hypothetical protein